MRIKTWKLYSILILKCPRCHQGQFLVAHPYHIHRWNRVKASYDCCGQNYKFEPSFYFGSMYVSFAVWIAVAVTLGGGVLLLGLDWSLMRFFITLCVTLLLLMPYIGAVSKAIWANIFIHYDPQAVEELKKIFPLVYTYKKLYLSRSIFIF